jgi:hypothetical protein
MRGFTISNKVFLNQELGPEEKMMITFFLSFINEGNFCYCTDLQIAGILWGQELATKKEKTVERRIKKLAEWGYIKRLNPGTCYRQIVVNPEFVEFIPELSMNNYSNMFYDTETTVNIFNLPDLLKNNYSPGLIMNKDMKDKLSPYINILYYKYINTINNNSVEGLNVPHSYLNELNLFEDMINWLEDYILMDEGVKLLLNVEILGITTVIQVVRHALNKNVLESNISINDFFEWLKEKPDHTMDILASIKNDFEDRLQAPQLNIF